MATETSTTAPNTTTRAAAATMIPSIEALLTPLSADVKVWFDFDRIIIQFYGEKFPALKALRMPAANLLLDNLGSLKILNSRIQGDRFWRTRVGSFAAGFAFGFEILAREEEVSK